MIILEGGDPFLLSFPVNGARRLARTTSAESAGSHRRVGVSVVVVGGVRELG